MGRSPRRRGDRGAAALEFGLVAPLILMFILGIIQYGYLFWSLQTASATAREAGRQLMVGTDQACTRDQAVAQASRPALGSTPPQMTSVYTDLAGQPAAAPVRGGLVTVTVTFHSLDMGIPFLPVPDDGRITQHATARVESVPPAPLTCDWTS
jgi:Flp pilus assembly protein TadG